MFSQRTLDFLYFNHRYNSPDWYKQHKADFDEYIFKPFKELVEQLAPTMLSIDDRFIVEAKTDRCISRIYKDMRYSLDGFRYRDRMWCVFIRDKKLYNGLPGYFFEVSPYGFRYGCGYYQADPVSIANYRQLIAEDSAEFKSALKCVKKQHVFDFYGNTVKLPHKYDALSDEQKRWLSYEEIGLLTESRDYDLLMSPDLAATVAKQFVSIKPYYLLMLKAELSRADR